MLMSFREGVLTGRRQDVRNQIHGRASRAVGIRAVPPSPSAGAAEDGRGVSQGQRALTPRGLRRGTHFPHFVVGLAAGLPSWRSRGSQAVDSGGSTCRLDEHTDAICDHITQHPPHTIAEARQAIEELTGIRRSETQVRDFLRRVGFTRLKTGSLPAKADPEAQAAFKKRA